MDFDEYQKAALRTASPLTTERERLLCGQAGLCGESGEVADIIKKFAFHGHPLDRAKLLKEMGDVMWYIALLSDGLGVTMEQVAMLNIEKLKARYPDGFSTERSLNREDPAPDKAPMQGDAAHLRVIEEALVVFAADEARRLAGDDVDPIGSFTDACRHVATRLAFPGTFPVLNGSMRKKMLRTYERFDRAQQGPDCLTSREAFFWAMNGFVDDLLEGT